jgi:magnesium transporter
LITAEVVWDPSPSLIAQLVEAGQPFWLDIENPIDEVIDQLATRLGLHPLAIEDSKQFGQRTKLQVYGNGVMLVASASMSSSASPSKCTVIAPPDS